MPGSVAGGLAAATKVYKQFLLKATIGTHTQDSAAVDALGQSGVYASSLHVARSEISLERAFSRLYNALGDARRGQLQNASNGAKQGAVDSSTETASSSGVQPLENVEDTARAARAVLGTDGYLRVGWSSIPACGCLHAMGRHPHVSGLHAHSSSLSSRLSSTCWLKQASAL